MIRNFLCSTKISETYKTLKIRQKTIYWVEIILQIEFFHKVFWYYNVLWSWDVVLMWIKCVQKSKFENREKFTSALKSKWATHPVILFILKHLANISTYFCFTYVISETYLFYHKATTNMLKYVYIQIYGILYWFSIILKYYTVLFHFWKLVKQDLYICRTLHFNIILTIR